MLHAASAEISQNSRGILTWKLLQSFSSMEWPRTCGGSNVDNSRYWYLVAIPLGSMGNTTILQWRQQPLPPGFWVPLVFALSLLCWSFWLASNPSVLFKAGITAPRTCLKQSLEGHKLHQLATSRGFGFPSVLCKTRTACFASWQARLLDAEFLSFSFFVPLSWTQARLFLVPIISPPSWGPFSTFQIPTYALAIGCTTCRRAGVLLYWLCLIMLEAPVIMERLF